VGWGQGNEQWAV